MTRTAVHTLTCILIIVLKRITEHIKVWVFIIQSVYTATQNITKEHALHLLCRAGAGGICADTVSTNKTYFIVYESNRSSSIVKGLHVRCTKAVMKLTNLM